MKHEGLDWGAYQRAKIRKELIEEEKKKKKKETTESRLGKDPRSNPSENSTFIALLFESLFVSFEFISSCKLSVK